MNQMKKISLDGLWRMRATDRDNWREAVVPGSVYADLLRNGELEDPFYRENELAAFELMRGGCCERDGYASRKSNPHLLFRK